MDAEFYDHERLRELRLNLRLTQIQVAARLGVKRQTIYRVEQGLSVSFKLLNRLASLYGIPITKILRAKPRSRAA